MKKFFTLIAAALLSSSAFAQGEWQNLVVNGDMEGEQDPEWSCFWCHDFPEGTVGEEQRQGFADIIEDPTNPENHCARVVARSEAVADAAENKVTPDGSSSLASWDCQFFIYATEAIPEGMELRMTLRVRAEKAGHFETQAHWAPGDYNHYQLFGNIDVDTEWKKIQVTATISADHTQSANEKQMQSVAFNLSTDVEGNVFYFDDVKLEIREPKGPSDFDRWFNMLRHGTQSNDAIGNRTNFTGRDGIDGVDRPARIVADPVDGEPALNVTSIGWNAKKQTTTIDEETGEEVIEESDIYIKENGDTLTNIDNWQTQFFITIPHKFTPNSKYRVKLWARADQPATVETQAHRMPGDYIHWQLLGNLELTEEWQCFEFDDQTVTSDQSGQGSFQTIAFNCNVPKEVVNYYFRVEEFSANFADVTEAERVLATENVNLPVPEPGKTDGSTGVIDFANCMQLLEATSFENLVNENMTMQSGDETYAPVDVTAGCYLSDNGWLSNEETPLSLEFSEVSDNDLHLSVTAYNEGESFEGKSVTSNFRYEFSDWFYLFSVNLIPEESYNGVTEISMQPNQGVIYDLSGRRVERAAKGLYILNGKKYIAR